MLIKVYGGQHRVPGGLYGSHYMRCIVAAKSKKQAAELFGVPTAFLRDYYSVTGNKAEIEAALAQPGVILKVIEPGRTHFEPLHPVEATK